MKLYTEKQLDQIMKHFDLNQDGAIDMNEFVTIFRSAMEFAVKVMDHVMNKGGNPADLENEFGQNNLWLNMQK